MITINRDERTVVVSGFSSDGARFEIGPVPETAIHSLIRQLLVAAEEFTKTRTHGYKSDQDTVDNEA